MTPKTTIDLFEVPVLEKKHEQALRDTYFKDAPKQRVPIDIMKIIMSLMQNPKKIKNILITVGISSLIGMIATVYIIISQSINLIEYLIKNI